MWLPVAAMWLTSQFPTLYTKGHIVMSPMNITSHIIMWVLGLVLHKGDLLGIGVIFGCVRREECSKLSHKSFRSLNSPGLQPYSLSEGVAIVNATTGGGRIGEDT